nr:PREDICTED: uncharacterized protein LOC109038225 [Bemisia tabaci]
MHLSTSFVATCIILMFMMSEVSLMGSPQLSKESKSKKFGWIQSMNRSIKLGGSSRGLLETITNYFSSSKKVPLSPMNSVTLDPEDEDLLRRAGIISTMGGWLSSVSPSIIENIKYLFQRVKVTLEALPGDAPVLMSKTVVIETMSLSAEQIDELEEATRDDGERLRRELQTRLTPDLFGPICLYSAPEALGIFLTSPRLPPDLSLKAWPVHALSKVTNKVVTMSGLVVDRDRGYLAALPDGVVQTDDAVVKVHVLQRPRRNGRLEAIAGDAVSKSSTIFYEIQGLLNITKRKECILIIVTRRHIRYVTVQRDEEFWIKNMLDKIVNFYETTLLPKLSEEMLPHMQNVRFAAKLVYTVLSALDNKRVREIYSNTKGPSAYDVLMKESRVRIMPEHYYLVMDPAIRNRERVREILKGYPSSRESWNLEQGSRKKFLESYLAANPGWDIEDGGLMIDRAMPYLAAYPTAFGVRIRPTPQFGKINTRLRSTRGFEVYSLEGTHSQPESSQPPQPRSNGSRPRSNREIKIDSQKPGSSPQKPTKRKRQKVIFEVVILNSADEKHLNTILSVDNKAGKRWLRKSSKYYYQVQGSMAISRVKECVFILAKEGTNGGTILHSEIIDLDVKVWHDLQQQLAHFYFGAYLVYHASPESFELLARNKKLDQLFREDERLFPTKAEIEDDKKKVQVEKKKALKLTDSKG